MRIVFDANFSRYLAEGILILEKSNLKSPHQIDEINNVYALDINEWSDEDLVEYFKDSATVIITLDSDFKRYKHLHELFHQHKVSVIIVESEKIQKYWNTVKLIVNKWEDLKKICNDCKDNLPFAYQLYKTGGISPLKIN